MYHCVLYCIQIMKKLMTKHFSKWASKQKISKDDLSLALTEVQDGNFEASLGGHIYKKRIKFKGQGKSGSGRTIICYKKGNRAIFIHGFAKNQKASLSKKELNIFKELSQILLNLSTKEVLIAINNGDIIEVKS
ncbi:MAG: hypothetical protein SRB1_01554 [Desulfobacteraceae bacterium Eth-SRB1]|nr:MAG: hypothetical protein SRB1_01554 [Desulfobacteraceae bacterium Eth-SRB1]